MRTAAVYLGLQLKRAGKMLPRMLAVTLVLAALVALVGLMLSRMNDSDDAQEKIRIGVVGDMEAGGVAYGVSVMESLDSTRFSLSLLPMPEEEASRALKSSELDAYLIVPDGFVDAMMVGEHRPVTFVTRDVGAGVGGILIRELAQTVSALVLETENAVYGLQDYTAENFPERNPYADGDTLTYKYMMKILDRDRLFQVETVGAADQLSLPGYYLCGFTVLFAMLWAISCTPLFTGRSRELSRLLSADGFGAAGQVLTEFISFVLLMLCGVLGAGLLGSVLGKRLGLTIPELAGQGAAGLWRFGLGALPAALMLCAMAFFLFELTDSTVGGILVLFFSAGVQGYLSGCFYPSTFFPEGLRTIGALLPAGTAMSHMRSLLLGNPPSWPVWAYFALFMILSVLIREYRLLTGKEATA